MICTMTTCTGSSMIGFLDPPNHAKQYAAQHSTVIVRYGINKVQYYCSTAPAQYSTVHFRLYAILVAGNLHGGHTAKHTVHSPAAVRPVCLRTPAPSTACCTQVGPEHNSIERTGVLLQQPETEPGDCSSRQERKARWSLLKLHLLGGSMNIHTHTGACMHDQNTHTNQHICQSCCSAGNLSARLCSACPQASPRTATSLHLPPPPPLPTTHIHTCQVQLQCHPIACEPLAYCNVRYMPPQPTHNPSRPPPKRK